jgi:hypothetical protein
MGGLTFAFLDFNPERFAQLVLNILAIGGGFLVGQIFFGITAWFIDRYLLASKSPLGLKRVIRLVGGVAVAILVAFIVFGHGVGWTMFGGGGQSDTNDTGTQPPSSVTTDDPTASPPTSSTPPVQDKTTISTFNSSTPTERVKITILGGPDVKDERFYLMNDDATPKKFAEVTAAVVAKRKSINHAVGLEIRFTSTNTLPREHPAVVRLTNWAQTNGVAVVYPPNP